MADADGDNYGSTVAPTGGVAGTDCQDSDSAINIAANEIPIDGVDQNCDNGDS